MDHSINLVTTDIDAEKKRFTDRIEYDGYEFSVIVSHVNIEQTHKTLDYLFYTPDMTDIPNFENMWTWKVNFYDDKERPCSIVKNGEHIYINLPYYKMIRTDIESGMRYLRIFHNTVNYLMELTYPAAINYNFLVRSDDC